MANIDPKQNSAGKQGDETRQNEHIDRHGKKKDDNAIYLEPEEDNTLQTPEEFAKDKGKVLGDEDESLG
jgi:hypothetical protein